MAQNPTSQFTFSKTSAITALLLLSAVISVAQSKSSVYTDLDAKKCLTIKASAAEGGEYQGKCRGVAGYTLFVTEGDLRTNIEVVTPRGAKHSLDLWTVVSSAFSSLGPKAEWRVSRLKNRVTPTALIIRYNASEDPEKPEKTTSYLAVAKITAYSICVTDKVAPGVKANEDARSLADGSATKPCLKAPE